MQTAHPKELEGVFISVSVFVRIFCIYISQVLSALCRSESHVSQSQNYMGEMGVCNKNSGSCPPPTVIENPRKGARKLHF